MSLKESLSNVTGDVRLGVGTAAAPTSTGLGMVLDYIPDDIGKLASCVGIVLSSVLIYTHIRKGRAEYEKIKLETEKLKSSM